MISNKTRQHGFTLIELLLSMSFIAFILLFIVAAILQVTQLYVKGIAIHQIDQTGRQLMEELGSSLRSGNVVTQPLSSNRLCVGGTSYIWNVEGTAQTNKFASPNAADTLRFIAVSDASAAYCTDPTLAVTKANSEDLVGGDITPLAFSLTQKGRLWTVALILSTAGSNLASADSTTATGFTCGTNQFCAFGDFETSVYSRGIN